MENFFELLDLETQEVIRACANEAVTDNEINRFMENSCEDSQLINFMFRGNETPLYTVTSDTIRGNKKFKCDERINKIFIKFDVVFSTRFYWYIYSWNEIRFNWYVLQI